MSERFDHISEMAKDLIILMLTKDPKERISAEEALNHPWVHTFCEKNKEMKYFLVIQKK